MGTKKWGEGKGRKVKKAAEIKIAWFDIAFVILATRSAIKISQKQKQKWKDIFNSLRDVAKLSKKTPEILIGIFRFQTDLCVLRSLVHSDTPQIPFNFPSFNVFMKGFINLILLLQEWQIYEIPNGSNSMITFVIKFTFRESEWEGES